MKIQEYYDELDKNGFTSGKKITKKDFSNKIYLRAVHLFWINDKNEILIQTRSAEQTHPLEKQISCTGHVNAKEASQNAILREIEEELGVKINKSEVDFLFSCLRKSENTKTPNYFIDIFVCKKDLKLSDFKIDKKEVEKIEWMPFKTFCDISLENQNTLFNWYLKETNDLIYLINNL